MKSLETSLRILSAFCGERSTWSVTELASALCLEKPLVSKNLSCFRAAGFLRHDALTRTYSAGIRSFLLGAQFLNNNPLVREAGAELRRLAERTRQTSTLCILEGSDVVHLASVEGPHFLDVGWRVGTWLPFHATAVGKVLFAFADPSLLEKAISSRGMRRFTATTICDPEAFKKQLAQTVQTGWSETNQESMNGLAAQAVPVFGAEPHVVAALGLIFPRHAVTSAERTKQINALHSSARKISIRLGAQVYPYGKVRQ
jgi:DNA-binding IclR family transcriptional regulator